MLCCQLNCNACSRAAAAIFTRSEPHTSRMLRAIADQRQFCSELARQLAKGVDYHVGLFLAIESADVDHQRLVVGEAKLVPQPRVAPVWPEFAQLDPQRDDLDIADAEAPELRR